jgi:hypothetical protein
MRVQSFLNQAPDEPSLLGGLNLINTQILDFFKPEHQAEFFRLKGLLHVVGPLLLCCRTLACVLEWGHCRGERTYVASADVRHILFVDMFPVAKQQSGSPASKSFWSWLSHRVA